MSNILIIKHGSLGDIVQISGAIRDIREKYLKDKIFILTTGPYVELLSICPFIDFVLLDRRLPRWNLIYLLKLKRMINKYNFSYVYDLQNSSRTKFYRKYLFKVKKWSSTIITLKNKIKKKDFDKAPVLKRFKFQLENSEVKTNYTLRPDFSWACTNIDEILNKYISKKFILLFPFSSPSLAHKQWPYFNELIKIIKSKHLDLEIVVAPGQSEIEQAKNIDAISVTNGGNSLNISELAGLVSKSSFVIANDTGPAHMAAHLGKSGVTLFGYHTSPEKVSIETSKFKAIVSQNLNNLNAIKVYEEIKDQLINFK